ncbi:MAG: hypothetical protein RL001_1722 [Pseudomonadota bacterium]|jgi:tRNA 2-selenouridine synthase
MKYPVLLSAGEALSDMAAFDTVIDVRSESEFALDHVPGAVNCPVLHDDERVKVGTLYKQDSPFKAKKIGAAIVARNIASHLEAHFSDHPKSWRPLVYCWRGGNRSGAMAHILAKIGWSAVQLEGGYKAYRQHMITQIDEMAMRFRFQVVCGTTGSGKSRLLGTLAAMGAQVLDLEKLAAHRGSLLGSLPGEPQPTQKMFESQIWQTLRQFNPERWVYVESESKKIGNLRVPEKLMESMRASACIRINISDANRVQLLIQDYPHLATDMAQLMSQLEHLTPLHGRQKIDAWRALAELGNIPALVEALLTQHYDPAYLKSINRNFSGYQKALPVNMQDISAAAFASAAAILLSDVM